MCKSCSSFGYSKSTSSQRKFSGKLPIYELLGSLTRKVVVAVVVVAVVVVAVAVLVVEVLVVVVLVVVVLVVVVVVVVLVVVVVVVGAGNVVIFNRICSWRARKMPLAALRVQFCVFRVGSWLDHGLIMLGSWSDRSRIGKKCHFSCFQ